MITARTVKRLLVWLSINLLGAVLLMLSENMREGLAVIGQILLLPGSAVAQLFAEPLNDFVANRFDLASRLFWSKFLFFNLSILVNVLLFFAVRMGWTRDAKSSERS